MFISTRTRVAAAAATILFGAGTLCAQAPSGTAPGTPGGAPGAGGAGGGGFRMQGPAPFDFADNTGFTPLFDSKTLNGWDYDKNLWDVKDGAIHIAATCEKPIPTVYAVSETGEYGDFILKYELKGTGRINSGMQFRSYMSADPNAPGTKYPPRRPPAAPGAGAGAGAGAAAGAGGGARPAGAPGGPGAAAGGPPRQPACANPGTPPSRQSEAKWDMFGPQADFDEGNNFSGMNYEQGGRSIIARPGYSLYADADGSPVRAVAKLAEKADLDSWFHKDDWNQFMIVCIGHSTSIYMNGHLVTEFVDMNPKYFRSSGKIGLEAESLGDVWARNISIKKLD